MRRLMLRRYWTRMCGGAKTRRRRRKRMAELKRSGHREEGVRDPKRIDRIVTLLHTYWTQHPDLRLAQLVSNMSPLPDPFYTEDDVIEEGLRWHLDITPKAPSVRSEL